MTLIEIHRKMNLNLKTRVIQMFKKSNQQARKSSLVFVALFICHNCFGVRFTLPGNEQYLINNYGKYDSVFMMSCTSFWRPSEDIFMVCFSHGQASLIHGVVHFKKDSNTIARIKNKKVKLVGNEDWVRFNANNIQNLNYDSLNNFYNYKTKRREWVSDEDEYTIAIILNKRKVIAKESYRITYYQEISPNQDRAYYIELLRDYNKLFHLGWRLGE